MINILNLLMLEKLFGCDVFERYAMVDPTGPIVSFPSMLLLWSIGPEGQTYNHLLTNLLDLNFKRANTNRLNTTGRLGRSLKPM